MNKLNLSALICTLAGAALADGLPDLTVPDGVGVNIHFTSGHEQDLAMIQTAGFKWVRQDFFWTKTERQSGVYDWAEYDAFTDSLEKHGLNAYYILDYSNPLYEKTVVSTNPVTGQLENRSVASPQQPASVQAFAQWAGAAAEHYRGRKVIWEIWNEPNISFWKPTPDASQYATLALATAKAMRAADPHVCIVAPTTSEFPWKFLETVFQSGLLEYLDAVSVHPYRGKPPETAARDYERLRELINRYAPAGRKIPIISGEWGYPTTTKGISLDTQAAYIVRQQLSNLSSGIPVSIWYDWKNDGNDPNNSEHNFGMVDANLKPKPAYLAVQTMTRELSGFRIAGRQFAGDTNDFILTFTNSAGVTKYASWTSGKTHEVILNPELKLELNQFPLYRLAPKAN